MCLYICVGVISVYGAISINEHKIDHKQTYIRLHLMHISFSDIDAQLVLFSVLPSDFQFIVLSRH